MTSVRHSRIRVVANLVLLTLAANTGAQAESKIKLGGFLDLGVRSTKNSGGRVESQISGSSTTSRLFLQGTEDLWDGYTAKFHLEGSIAADTGTPGTGAQFFDRQSTVALAGPFGEVRFGRDWTPTYLGFLFADPFLNTGVAGGANFLSSTAATTYQRAFGTAPSPTTLSRSSNAIEYLLPRLASGLYGHVMYAPGERSNALGSFRYQSGRIGIAKAPLDFSVYGGRTRIDATGRDIKQVGTFGSLKLSGVKLMLSVTRSSYLDSKHLHVMGGLHADFPKWILKLSYNKLDQSGFDAAGATISGNDAHQFGLGADYKLSKSGSTAIYGHAARLSNKGAATFAIPGGATTPITPGSRSTGFELGLRHAF